MDSLDLNMLDHADDKQKEHSDEHQSRTSASLELKQKKSESIRSTAVVTYSAAKYPALFSQLAPFTNLNLAPSNWLRNAPGLRPNFIFSRSRPPVHNTSDSPLFSSFQMADSHLRIVGDIDVVSDAENLKKLLKAPYSKTHLCMAVHRIENTLLLEQFDINHESLKPQGWKWFNDMYKQLTQKGILKKKLPSAQHERLMLSKFLYYSLRQKDGDASSVNFLEPSDALTIEKVLPNDQHKPRGTLNTSVEVLQVNDMPKPTEKNSVIPAELRWKYWTPDDEGTSQCFDIRNTFERTIFWTFEDLQMLLGTNMPIFGGGEYPAVSLRLLDSNKPINILTGIDYWLDNLICNVPEVVMCFHVNGIVQKYEVIKTEEIPKISSPKFSPQVIKDIAQNVLSFLKSKCTKEGHTYWLFKGSNDDVVKLYDLTSLCHVQSSSESQRNDAQNPFILSVATLQYKMAISLMKQQKAPSKEQSATIKKLLRNCVKLLEQQDQLAPVMLDAALCMLSTLCLPDPTEDVEVASISNIMRLRTNSISDSPEKQSGVLTENVANAEIAVISSVNELSIPEKFKSDTCLPDTVNHAWEEPDNYSIALSYILKGLHVFNRFNSRETVKSGTAKHPELLFVHMQMIRNITLIYYALAKHAYASSSYGKALQSIKVALLSYEYLEQLIDVQLLQSDEEVESSSSSTDIDAVAVLQSTTPPEYNLLLPRLFSLCGDIQMLQCQWTAEQKLSFHLEYEKFCQSDSTITKALDKNFLGVGQKYKNAIRLSTRHEEILDSCRVCFETALSTFKSDPMIAAKNDSASNQRKKEHVKKLKDAKKLSNNETALKFSLNRKLGHVANEQGAMQLDAAVQLLKSSVDGQDLPKEREMWKLSYNHFEIALNCFVTVRDNTNQALVLSNLGRLMRVCAQSTAQNEDERFTLHEQQLYDSAIEYYKRAIALQKQTKNRKATASHTDKHTPSIADNLSWELSVAYFTLAQRLQDHPPLNMKPRDELEKIILDLLSKSLKCCADIWKKTEKRSQASYHAAKIHARLASLYHSSSRDTGDLTKKRHLRSLAEVQYEKSCAVFSGLDDQHMCEYLRVALEWLALKEQYLPSVTNQNTKIKLFQEGFKVMFFCVRPLTVLSDSLKTQVDFLRSSESSPVDPQNHADNLISGNLKEWNALSVVLATILKSFLLSLLKLTALSSDTSGSSKKKSHNVAKLPFDHNKYKQIYSRSLRLLQESNSSSVIKHDSLLKKSLAIVEIIEDLR